MHKNRNIIKIVVIITLLVSFCVIGVLYVLRVRKNPMTESETEESTLPIEETSVEMETIVVEADDAADKLYHSLNIAVSEENDLKMDEVITGLSESAAMGNSDAMYFLGELYFQGIGVEIDRKEAGRYFQDACDSGNRRAMKIYAKMLFMGDGVKQNYDESAAYFYTLSDSDGEAAYILGMMSNLGMGVPRSAEKAQEYIDKAVSLGYEDAASYKQLIFDIGKPITAAEGFRLQAKKISKLQYGEDYDELQQLIDRYQKMLLETERYTLFEDEITALFDVDKAGIGLITLFGNDGYLFHQNENDGTSLHDYIGDNHFSKDELEKIATKLEKQKEWVEANGAEFVLLLIPNKECMYAENMPAYIRRENLETRQDLLAEYLQKETDINVVYVKDTLLSNKDTFPLYYKTDTHANMVGSLFMVSDLLESCYGKTIVPDMDEFDIHLDNYMGDLGRMANCSDRYAQDKVYFYPESSAAQEDKIDSSIMLVGDSFSEFINIEAEYYLSGGVDHRMITEYDYDYHSATQAGFRASRPEYVVWECVERYLERLQ